MAGHTEEVRSVAFSLDGRYGRSGSSDNTLKLWDIATGRDIRTCTSDGYGNSVAFSSIGRIALSADNDTFKLLDLTTCKEIRTFRGHSGTVYSVAVSPDGHTALFGSEDQNREALGPLALPTRRPISKLPNSTTYRRHGRARCALLLPGQAKCQPESLQDGRWRF